MRHSFYFIKSIFIMAMNLQQSLAFTCAHQIFSFSLSPHIILYYAICSFAPFSLFLAVIQHLFVKTQMRYHTSISVHNTFKYRDNIKKWKLDLTNILKWNFIFPLFSTQKNYIDRHIRVNISSSIKANFPDSSCQS